jgi:dolichol-phosphate mannosyltransferase
MNTSILIPVYNEEENISELVRQILENIKKTKQIKKYEIIFIDDGSADNTKTEIKKLNNSMIKIISFKKNKGKSSALWAGFLRAKYVWIITLDGDLQDNPADIQRLVSKASEGFDCVCGRRIKRSASLIKMASAKIANRIHQVILKDDFKDLVSPLKIIRKKAALQLPFFEGTHRFIPVLLKSKGFNVGEIDVEQKSRYKGKSSYGVVNRIFNSAWGLYKVKKIMKMERGI